MWFPALWLTALLLLLLPPAVTPAGATEHTVGVAPGDEKTVAIRTTELGERHDLIVRNDAHPDSHDFVTGKDPGEEIVGSSDTALWERTNDTVHTKNYTVIGTQPGQNLWLEVRVSFVPKAAGGGGGAPPPDATVLVPGAFLVSLTFTSGEGIDDDHHPVYRDPVPNEPDELYPVPHWHRDRDAGDQSPVCYRSGVNIVVDGKWELLPAAAWPDSQYVVTGYRVVNQLPGPKLVEAAGTATGGTFTLSGAGFEDPLPDTVHHEEAMEIHWTISAPEGAQGTDEVDAGRSANELYVVLNAPNLDPAHHLWHTVLHLACTTNHANNRQGVIDAVWSKFTEIQGDTLVGLVTVGEEPLAYYDPHTLATTLREMLLPPHSGQCLAFCRLLLACLQVHGVEGFKEAEIISVFNMNDPNPANAGKTADILVREWTFDEIDEVNSPSPDLVFRWTSDDFRDGTRVPAQNNSSSPSGFNNHYVVIERDSMGELSGIYDPSYGIGKFNELREWESAALSGQSRYAQPLFGPAVTVGRETNETIGVEFAP